ncbi:hypothetical protein Tco_0438356 [Tanacetum coccineum]
MYFGVFEEAGIITIPNGVRVGEEVANNIGSLYGVEFLLAIISVNQELLRVFLTSHINDVNLVASFNSPLCTSIKARLVFKKHLPRIKGTRGVLIRGRSRQVRLEVMTVGLDSGSESFPRLKNGIEIRAEHRVSANATHSSIPGNSQEVQELVGSPYVGLRDGALIAGRLINLAGSMKLILTENLTALLALESSERDEISLEGSKLQPVLSHIRAAPSDREWIKAKHIVAIWNIGDPYCGGDLVEVADMSMRIRIASRVPLGAGCWMQLSSSSVFLPLALRGCLPERGFYTKRFFDTMAVPSGGRRYAAHGD